MFLKVHNFTLFQFSTSRFCEFTEKQYLYSDCLLLLKQFSALKNYRFNSTATSFYSSITSSFSLVQSLYSHLALHSFIAIKYLKSPLFQLIFVHALFLDNLENSRIFFCNHFYLKKYLTNTIYTFICTIDFFLYYGFIFFNSVQISIQLSRNQLFRDVFNSYLCRKQ